MKVLRILIYDGPREWVEQTLRTSYVDSRGKACGPGRLIIETYRTELKETTSAPDDPQAESDHAQPDPDLQAG